MSKFVIFCIDTIAKEQRVTEKRSKDQACKSGY